MHSQTKPERQQRMSGGHFNYAQSQVSYIADQIDELIAQNASDRVDEMGYPVSSGYSQDTIKRFQEAAHTLRRASEMTQRVDWLVSGDDGEEDFHRRWAESVRAEHLPTEP